MTWFCVVSQRSKEDLKVMVGCVVELCKRRDLKLNAAKNKVMVLGGEEGLSVRFA